MINEKLVRKVLRTLPKRFAHKVTAIEEAHDLTTMRFDELIENLTTFEMMFESMESNKRKGIALQASCEDKEEEDLAETMSLLRSDNKVSNFVAFTARDTKESTVSPTVIDCSTDNMSDDEGDLTEEELMANYQMVFMKLSKLNQAYTAGETERSALM
ncbi:hypothetical protein LIER_28367 [Lithospermum erythrorhizon]|uniref:Gag-pol polyprotein n=1 Tax=Lithospermum erythrorhizon TaxID=34254 RepID=A0AAV3RJL8_LITER